MTSPIPRAPSRMVSSQRCDATPPSPTNASPKPAAASTNSTGQYTPTKVKSATLGMATGTPTCPPSLSEMGDEWTSKCPPTMVRMSLPDGFESWGTVRLLPEQESTSISPNMWSLYSSHQTTHSDPLPPYLSGLSNYSKPREGPTTPWLKRPIVSSTPPPSPKWNDTAATTSVALSSKSIDG